MIDFLRKGGNLDRDTDRQREDDDAQGEDRLVTGVMHR